MTPGQFRRRVYDAFPGSGIQRQFFAVAVNVFLNQNRTGNGDVAECIELARRLWTNFQDSSGKQVFLAPRLTIDSDKMTQQITPEVERVRLEIFRKRTAPFASLGRAARWIEKGAKDQPRPG